MDWLSCSNTKKERKQTLSHKARLQMLKNTWERLLMWIC